MKKASKLIEGKWWKIRNKIKKSTVAKYDRIKDWKMDPKGYFLIKIDKESKKIRVAYCLFSKLGNNPIHDMVAEVIGDKAIEIVNTLIRKKYISTLQHASDMGIELCKAEIALKKNLNYVQDSELNL
jgi:Dihydropteroate synthase and related enzymes